MGNETKWTPGPWKISDAVGLSIWADVRVADCKPEQSEVYRDRSEKEMRANAHLIAAAPDLYEALFDLLCICEGGPDEPDECGLARAALAAARGEN